MTNESQDSDEPQMADCPSAPCSSSSELPTKPVVKKSLTTETMTKRIYMARIPGTGYFLRCPRWIYNRWPWAGIVRMWDIKTEYTEAEKAQWWRSGWSRKYRKSSVIQGPIHARLIVSDIRWTLANQSLHNYYTTTQTNERET